ncbi:unnamed protein product, partial [Prorocentrum cordatum]
IEQTSREQKVIKQKKFKRASSAGPARRLTPLKEADAEDPGSFASGSEIQDWQKANPMLDEILDTEGMSEHELQLFHEGALRLEPAKENTDDCPHPPWAQWSRANGHATYKFCGRCNTRIAYHKKTEEEKAEAAVRRMAKAKSAQVRKEVKQMVEQQVKRYEGPRAGISVDATSKAPANLYVYPKNGYVPIKAAPTVDPYGHISSVPPPATAIPAKPPPGTRPLNQLEVMQAISDMTHTVQQQRWKNERNFQSMSEMINHPALTDSDMERLACTMIRVMQRVSQGDTPSSGSGATQVPEEPEDLDGG